MIGDTGVIQKIGDAIEVATSALLAENKQLRQLLLEREAFIDIIDSRRLWLEYVLGRKAGG